MNKPAAAPSKRATRSAITALLLASVFAILTVGCSSQSGDVLTSGPTGAMSVVVHDQSAPRFQEAWITFGALSAHHVAGEWASVSGPFPITVDLLTLVNGRSLTLGADQLPEGQYDALRVTITAARLVLADGTEVTVTLPSGGRTMDVSIAPPANVVAGQTVTIALDFRPDTSFHQGGMGMGWSCDPDIMMSGVSYH